MPTPDIVIVKPGSQRSLYGRLGDFNLTAIEPPLWGALLAGFLRQKGYGVELIDAEVEGWDYQETAARIVAMKPRLGLICVSGTNPSASTMNLTGAGKIAGLVKNMDDSIPLALSGLHPSALPARTLLEEPVDFVVQGEGFFTLPGLLDCLKNGGSPRDVPGLWRREDGLAVSGPPATVWPDLDTLPQPAWDLLPMAQYRAHNWHCFDHIDQRQPYAVIYTSLGCPFKCQFCCINALFGRPGLRYRRAENVVAEIDGLVRNHGVKNIKIIDEMFAFKNDRVEPLCDLLAQRGYDLNMWAYARVDTVNPKMLEKMKKAGINWVAYGFESGSERVLKSVEKRYDPQAVRGLVQMTREQGLYICGNYILGLPDDDQESMEETLSLAVEINAEWANIYTAMALPGSRLYEEALKQGWPLPQTWEGYSPYSRETLPLPTKYLSPEQVLRFRDQAFQEYYTNPAYLKMIREKFGNDTVNHIQDMAGRRLERWYDTAPVEINGHET